MASYDTDSSSEGEDNLRTNVTLGYVSEEATGDEISHTGGHPTWLNPNITPSPALIRCKVCNENMSLLLQLHADLQQHFPEDERRLFIWCCRKKQCSRKPGSVRAFREVKKARVDRSSQSRQKETAKPENQPMMDLGSQLFGGPSRPAQAQNSNPFSTTFSTSQSTNINPFATSNTQATATQHSQNSTQPQDSELPLNGFTDKLKISSTASNTEAPKAVQPTEAWPSESSFPSPFPRFHLDAEVEYLDPTPSTGSAAGPSNFDSRITELEDDGEDSAKSARVEKDLYESPHDKTFSHFTHILSQNPEQVLRYDFRGTPLLYSSTDIVASHFVLPGHARARNQGPVKGIPRCGACDSARIFECQLVPNLIYELEKDDEDAMKIDGSGMEWGTVIVGTCGKNCGEEGTVAFREEWVGVQWEEEAKANK